MYEVRSIVTSVAIVGLGLEPLLTIRYADLFIPAQSSTTTEPIFTLRDQIQYRRQTVSLRPGLWHPTSGLLPRPAGRCLAGLA
jgi:hypothetical protein